MFISFIILLYDTACLVMAVDVNNGLLSSEIASANRIDVILALHANRYIRCYYH